MTINKVRIEDDAGNAYFPHTSADIVLTDNGQTVEQRLASISMPFLNVLNLTATQAGFVNWQLPVTVDQTRIAIVLCMATKDITNLDYAACLADNTIVKNTLTKDAVTNSYTGLSKATKYWVKAFVEYAIGGKKYYSNGVTVTFTTPAATITEFYNAGQEFTAVTGGWINGFSQGTGSQSKQSGNLYLETQGDSNASSYRTYKTNNLINYANYKKIYIEWENVGSNIIQNWAAFDAGLTDVMWNSVDPKVFKYNIFSRTISELDVTNINDVRNLRVSSNVAALETTSYSKVKVYRVWGES